MQAEKAGNLVEISRQRVEVGWDPERPMAKVAGFFHLDAFEPHMLRRKTRARMAAMKCFYEQAGLSQQ